MNVLSKLSIKNLYLNKKRTIGTIIGIILSVALICAVAGMGMSFRASIIEDQISSSGYYHVQVEDVKEEDIIAYKINRDVKSVHEIAEVGVMNVKDELLDAYMYIYSLGKDTNPDDIGMTLMGKMPQKEDEIVISKYYAELYSYQIGDIVTLEMGERYRSDNSVLDESTPKYEDEVLKNVRKKTYRITGITEYYCHYNQSMASFVKEEKKEHIDAYIALKNPFRYKKSIPAMLGIKKIGEKATYNYSLNNGLLRWEIFAFSDNTIQALTAMIGIVIVIIIFTSVFCIRNSFAIATTEKIKMYGMLASVGATKKQIRKNVIHEALLLGIVGIPLGILSGYFATFILVHLVNFILYKFIEKNILVFSISIIPILFASLLGIITIYLSSLSSAIRASKVSPIDQLRSTQEIKLTRKLLKIPRIISKVFKTGGILAYKNLKRSKKKYRTTVISLAVSVFVFISMSQFISLVFGTSSYFYQTFDYDILVNAYEFKTEELNRIRKIEKVEESYLIYSLADKEDGEYTSYKLYDDSRVKNKESISFQEGEYDEKTQTFVKIENPYINIEILALEDEDFKHFIKRAKLSYNKVKNKAILSDYYYLAENDKVKEERIYNYRIGDKIPGKVNEIDMPLEIGAITSLKPYGYDLSYMEGGTIIVNKEYYESKLFFTPSTLAIVSDKPDDVEEKIKEMNSELNIYNIDKETRLNKSMVLIISIFLYGFIVVISLIGVTNVFNTITSNMELRQKEFAMLKSVGMTRKEFNRMINLETIFYSTKALLFGIISGCIASYFLYKGLINRIDLGFKLPVAAIIIATLCVFILVYIIMKYSIHKISKQNIIETIRKDNI